MKSREYCAFCDNVEIILGKILLLCTEKEFSFVSGFGIIQCWLCILVAKRRFRFEVLTGKCGKNRCFVCVYKKC